TGARRARSRRARQRDRRRARGGGAGMTAPGGGTGAGTGSGSGSFPGGPGGGSRRLPERIGHFRVLDRIGRGAMGVVYSARDEQSARRVAIEAMTADLEGARESREPFIRAGPVAGPLRQRHVI